MAKEAIKAMSVCTGNTGVVSMKGVFHEDILTIVSVKTYGSGIFGTWAPTLRKDIKDSLANGLNIVVEESRVRFSTGVNRVYLEKTADNGKPNFVNAMRTAEELKSLKLIRFKDPKWQNIVTSENLINRKIDARGGESYSIDPTEFNSKNRAFLLLVLAACGKTTAFTYYQALLKDMEEEQVSQETGNSLYAITRGFDIAQMESDS